MNEWISVEDRLPKIGTPVIVQGGCGYYDGENWRTYLAIKSNGAYAVIQWKVTHWMPLPAPPAEEGE